MTKRSRNVALGAVAVLTLTLLLDLSGLAALPFYSHGEPREGVVVQEMWRGNGLILPLINGEIIPWKPPMFHWLGLAVSRAIGEVSAWSVRLPSAALGIGLTLAVFFFGAAVGRIRSGWLAALILATNFEWIRAARTARVDMTLTVFVAGALLLFAWLRHRQRTRQVPPSPPARLGFWLLLAAGTLTKGPVAIVLPLLVIGIWALSAPLPSTSEAHSSLRLRLAHAGRVLEDLHPRRGLAMMLTIVAAWYLAAWSIGGTDFLVRHALMENVLRVLDAERLGSGHVHGPFYMVAHLFLGFLPWSFLAPSIAFWLWRARPLDETTRLLVVWVAVLFVFFLVPESKRGVYYLPAYPALALLAGLTLGPGPEGETPRRLVAWQFSGIATVATIAAFLVLSAFLAPLEGLFASFLKPRDAAGVRAALDGIRAGGIPTFIAALAITGLAALVAWQARGAHWLRASFPLAALLVLLIVGIILPAERGIAESRSLRDFTREALARTGDRTLGIEEDSFDWGALFYADRHLPNWRPDTPEPDMLILRRERLGLVAPGCAEILASKGPGVRGRYPYVLTSCSNEENP